MRRLALSMLFILTATGAVASTPGQGWHIPGWYISKNTAIKQAITIYGAYQTRDDCEMARTSPKSDNKPDFTDHGSITFECVYLDREPMR